ncbi:MAG: hypothetical protein LBS67_06920 [Clostridiales Family XIII bacterium]|jgi:hypothetical protein|nr:hypothetical protein [Clostridiales Family XIII bacterium]
MKKSDLRVIVGGASEVSPWCERSFVSAYATNSRLMGVFVVYAHWEQKTWPGMAVDPSALGASRLGDTVDLHQFFYIETTEIGLETYKSIWGEAAIKLMEAEQSMAGGLGAEKVDLTERETRLIIREYAGYNKKFGERLPEGEAEYGFLLSEPVEEPKRAEWETLFAKICASPENDYELINYFLMRYFAADADAVRYLTARGRSDGRLPAPWRLPDTLCLNKIRTHRDETGKQSYICESLIESGADHHIIVSEIEVFGGRVASFDIINDFAISGAETAMKLERPEFITVYEIFTDPEKAMEHLDARYLAAMQRDTDAGRLYLRFNENNDHMKHPMYRLNDDVKGMIYVTEEAQLILAAYSLPLIHRLEREAQSWPFCRQLLPVAKYEFKEDIFYDFVRADTGDFLHYVNYICDFDPEDR